MISRNHFLAILALGLAVDLCSAIAWAHPAIATLMAIGMLCITALVAIQSARGAVAVVLLELLWGGHGYLFRIPMDGVNLSLRMGIFVIVLACTMTRCLQRDVRQALLVGMRHHPARWPIVAFACTLVLAGILGVRRHAFGDVFFDANGWAFLALAPAFLLGARTAEDARWVRNIFLMGAGYLILRTYMLLFAFSHDLGGIWLPLYQWIRDTRLGEITMSIGGLPRIFLPSMALLFPAVLLAGSRMMRVDDGTRMQRLVAGAVCGGGIAVLVMSLSRSFWLAGAALLALGILWPILRFIPGLRVLAGETAPTATYLRVGVPAVIIAFVLAWITVQIPYPAPLTNAGWGSALARRFSLQEPAAANRWQELGPLRGAIAEHAILGNGFGTMVTYTSKDPRTLVAFPDGQYTTAAFEWGYLDHALESGILGVLVFLIMLVVLVLQGLRRGGDTAALALGLLALMGIHATTPYLNHPIGLGILLWLIAVVAPFEIPKALRP